MRRPVVLVGAAAQLLLLTSRQALASCPNHCSGHGECTSGPLVTCSCFRGWEGGDCSIRSCPTGVAWTDVATADDTAHADGALCSNRGACDESSGQCDCGDGFEGRACQRMECPEDCSAAGTCVSMRRFAQVQFNGNEANKPYTTNWDADKIFGCDCDLDRSGYDCSLRLCPRGDDPMTTGQADEVQIVQCDASGGSFTLGLDGRTTVEIAYDATHETIKAALDAIAGSVTVSGLEPSDTVACDLATPKAFAVTFLQRHGDVPVLKLPAVSALTGGTMAVTDGTDGNNDMTHPDSGATFSAVQGTKEWNLCSGRGRCDTSRGICSCFPGFESSDGRGNAGTRGDCGYQDDPITSCPGTAVECSGHGSCSGSPAYECTCQSGWRGGDCGQRTCPTGAAWFDAPSSAQVAHAEDSECSGRGLCDRSTGRCSCGAGFTGTACERTACPRGEGSGEECSGHGRCASMATLASLSETNGESTPFVYGSSSPSDSSTWDAYLMFGCKCDEGYGGFDCSERTCPFGDDPKTPGVAEVQDFTCQAEGGTFTMTFRDQTTASVAYNALPSELKAALEDLSSTSVIHVECTDGAAADVCKTDTSNVCEVTFEGTHGDLPLLQAVDTSLTHGTLTPAIAVSEVTAGTTESIECSGRGRCSRQTGECACFSGFGSSNGTNHAGDRRDCGYQLPFVRWSGEAAGGDGSVSLMWPLFES